MAKALRLGFVSDSKDAYIRVMYVYWCIDMRVDTFYSSEIQKGLKDLETVALSSNLCVHA